MRVRRARGRDFGVRAYRALIAALLIVGSIAAGAGTALATAPTKSAAVPPGYVSTPIKAAAVSLAVPETWLAIDPKSPTAAAGLQAASDKNPKLASLLDQFQTIRSSISFWAIDQGATSFASNVLVLPSGLDKAALRQPAAFETALRQQLGTTATSVKARKVRVGSVNAIEADSDLMVQVADGTSVPAYSTALFVPTKKGVIDVNYTSGSPREGDTTLTTMFDSLRII